MYLQVLTAGAKVMIEALRKGDPADALSAGSDANLRALVRRQPKAGIAPSPCDGIA